ncbi:MAG: NAD(P)-dependent oxidoreductase [Bacillota bacterium]|nr:NAD(P)-dependent oxidoreductase [Bacillota bacterium]
MIQSYPVMLHLNGKKVVVVGGGKIAERKVIGLLESHAEVWVISPEVTGRLSDLALEGRIHWQQKTFSSDDTEGAFMVFAATNNKDVNLAVKAAVGEDRLVLIVDDPQQSTFHVPAVLQRSRLCIAVSTNGASPTLSKNIRDQLADEFDEGYESYLDFLFAARELILEEVQDPFLKNKLLKSLVSDHFLKSHNREKELAIMLDQIKEQ